MRIVTLDENSKQNLLNDLLKRSPNHYGEFIDRVNDIISKNGCKPCKYGNGTRKNRQTDQ